MTKLGDLTVPVWIAISAQMALAKLVPFKGSG